MKRLSVFAHYDKDNIIDGYVIYYLKALKEICNTIIFVSDCYLSELEQNKIKDIADYIIAEKHGEYDFGSYKRGYLFALENSLDFDELIFVNDSCYGPFYPLKPIFEKMEKKKCDFWGMTHNSYGIPEAYTNNDESFYIKPPWIPHIQSYFLVFNSKIIKNDIFNNFIANIKKLESKNDIIRTYEIGLTVTLKEKGFKPAVYINKFKFEHNSLATKWDILIKKYRYPFLKTTIAKNGIYYIGEVKNWKQLIKSHSDYPVELIECNSRRLKDLYENQYKNANLYRKIRYNILKNFPPEVRVCVVYIEKYTYKLLNRICFNKLKKF